MAKSKKPPTRLPGRCRAHGPPTAWNMFVQAQLQGRAGACNIFKKNMKTLGKKWKKLHKKDQDHYRDLAKKCRDKMSAV